MVSSHNDAVHRGDWENSKDFILHFGSLNELSCMTIGIVGLGAIGRKLAAVADAIGMRIVAALNWHNRLKLSFNGMEITDDVLTQADFCL